MKVVFIGPDPQIVEMVGLSLSLRWPTTSPLVATSFEEGVELLERTEADVIILQSDLPDISLAKALPKIRSFSNAPALVLGRQGNETEVITALDMGADDYVRLPFDLTELMARVWALLRRATANDYQEGESPIRSGELFINPSTYEVFLGNKEVSLTSTEFTLLYLLAQKRGSVVSHQTLGRSLWGEEVDSSGLVKKNVQRLRTKLDDTVKDSSWIANVHGVGYRFIGPKSEGQGSDESKPLAVLQQS